MEGACRASGQDQSATETDNTCAQSALEWLTVAERDAFHAASTSPSALTATLLGTIERLAHEMAHAHCGGLECDQAEKFGPRWQPLPVPARPPATPEVKEEPGPVSLYRFYDKCGCLLYIGITNNFDVRLASHEKTSPWYKLFAAFTVTEMPSRADAAAAELAAINAESPAFNSAGRSSQATAEQITAYLLAHARTLSSPDQDSGVSVAATSVEGEHDAATGTNLYIAAGYVRCHSCGGREDATIIEHGRCRFCRAA